MAAHGRQGEIPVGDIDSETSTQASTDLKALGPPEKKLKAICTGRFKASWQLPAHIARSAKGESFAYCSLCRSDFSVLHGG